MNLPPEIMPELWVDDEVYNRVNKGCSHSKKIYQHVDILDVFVLHYKI